MKNQQGGATEGTGDNPTLKNTKTDHNELSNNTEKADFQDVQILTSVQTQINGKFRANLQFFGPLKSLEEKEAIEIEHSESKHQADHENQPKSPLEKNDPDTLKKDYSLISDSNERIQSETEKKKHIVLDDLRINIVKKNHQGLIGHKDTDSGVKIPITDTPKHLFPTSKDMPIEGSPTAYKPGFHRFSVIGMVRAGGGVMQHQDFSPRNLMAPGNLTNPKENMASVNASLASLHSPNDTMTIFAANHSKFSKYHPNFKTDEPMPSVTAVENTKLNKITKCKSVLRVLAYLLFFLVVFGIISVGFSFLANKYDNHTYELWGRGLILGFLFALLDALLMKSVVRECRLQSKASKSYSSICVCIMLSLIISPIICVGVISGIRNGIGPTHYNQVLALLVVTVINGIFYYLYLRIMKRHYTEKTDKKVPGQGFFTTHIYKDFMMEIHDIGSKIKTNRQHVPDTKDQPVQNETQKNKTYDSNVANETLPFDRSQEHVTLIPAKNSTDVHFFLVVALGQLALCFGMVHLIQYSNENWGLQGIYAVVLAYPFFSGTIRKIASRIIKGMDVFITPSNIQAVALAFAAFPWRIILLNMQGYKSILITLICKAAYKTAVYVVFPCLFLARLQQNESFKQQLQKRWKKVKKVFRKCLNREDSRHNSIVKTRNSVFEAPIHNVDEGKQRIAQAHHFVSRFAMLEFVDFMSIFSFSVYILIFEYLTPGTFLVGSTSASSNHNSSTQGLSDFDWTGIERVLIYNAIDLGTELIIIFATVLTWHKCPEFRETSPWKEVKQSLYNSRLVLLLAITFVFYSTSINVPGYFL